MQKQLLLLLTSANLAYGARPRLMRIDHHDNHDQDHRRAKVRFADTFLQEEEDFLFAQIMSFSMPSRKMVSTETSSYVSPKEDTQRRLKRDGKERLADSLLFDEEEELLFAQDFSLSMPSRKLSPAESSSVAPSDSDTHRRLQEDGKERLANKFFDEEEDLIFADGMSFSMPSRKLESTERSSTVSADKEAHRKLKTDGKERLANIFFDEEEDLIFADGMSFSMPSRKLESTERSSTVSADEEAHRKLKSDGKERLADIFFDEEEDLIFAEDLSFSMEIRRLEPKPATPSAATRPRYLRIHLDTDEKDKVRQRNHRKVSPPATVASALPDARSDDQPRRLRTAKTTTSAAEKVSGSLVEEHSENEFGRS